MAGIQKHAPGCTCCGGTVNILIRVVGCDFILLPAAGEAVDVTDGVTVYSTTTDVDGFATFTGLPSGTYSYTYTSSLNYATAAGLVSSLALIPAVGPIPAHRRILAQPDTGYTCFCNCHPIPTPSTIDAIIYGLSNVNPSYPDPMTITMHPTGAADEYVGCVAYTLGAVADDYSVAFFNLHTTNCSLKIGHSARAGQCTGLTDAAMITLANALGGPDFSGVDVSSHVCSPPYIAWGDLSDPLTISAEVII